MYINQNLSTNIKPNLLVVGFPRCGTSSLFKYLADHPNIAVPSIKETYFLVDKNSPFKQKWGSIHESQELFLRFLPNYYGEKYVLDATPCYFVQQTALDYAANNSSTKVIFIIRNPVERIYSSFMYIKHVLQESPWLTFSDFVDAAFKVYRDKYQTNSLQEVVSTAEGLLRFEIELGIEAGHYVEHFNKWINALGKDRVFIGDLTEMRETPYNFMRKVCTFLEIDNSYYRNYQFKLYNKSFKVRFPFLQKWARRLSGFDKMHTNSIGLYHSHFHFIRVFFVKKIVDYIYNNFQNITSYSKSPDDELALKKLINYYKVYNTKLYQEFNINFISVI